jgi:hypothetical protein
VNRGRIPRLRKSWLQHAITKEGTWLDAKQALNQGACRNADTVAKVAIALTSGCIVRANLSEVARLTAVVHLVDDVGLHQSEAFF